MIVPAYEHRYGTAPASEGIGLREYLYDRVIVGSLILPPTGPKLRYLCPI